MAIKIIKKDFLSDIDKINIKREFNILTILNNPNVILIAEIFESSDSFYIVMEYSEKILSNYLKLKKHLSEDEASIFYFQIIQGLEYIHSLDIVHMNLNLDNLILNENNILKIIDFSLSDYSNKGEKIFFKSLSGNICCYDSPEMLQGKKYDGIKFDIWSTAIILFYMLCGYLPFEDKNNDILLNKILECNVEFPEFLSEESKDLIKRILIPDPDKRISIKEIKNHIFYLKGEKFFNSKFKIQKKLKENFKNLNEVIKLDKNSLNTNNNKEEILNKETLFLTKEGRIIFKNGLLRGIIHKYSEIENVINKIQDILLKKVKFNLVYKAFDIGDKAKTFHEKCDKLSMSLVVIETDNGVRFGGFTTRSWKGNMIQKKDNNAFVFNLNNNSIFNIIKNMNAIGCYLNLGPIFLGCQIRINNEFFSKGGSTCCKGLNYKTKKDYELNNGERNFLIKDIEIYGIETIDT